MTPASAGPAEDLGRRIVIVDDDDDYREILRSLFAAEGYSVYTAGNGRAALELLDVLRPPPRCVILDLRMPVMDGWEFMLRLRARHVAPPVIVVSGEADPPKGARCYFPKPVGFGPLLAAVRACCE
jgi:two-component system KDP operon response regulator KdpE